jgi:hypothetical protein
MPHILVAASVRIIAVRMLEPIQEGFICPLFQLRRALLAIKSEPAEVDSHVKGTCKRDHASPIPRQTRRDSRMAARRDICACFRGKEPAPRRLVPMDHTQTNLRGTRMVEPNRPDLAEAAQPLSAVGRIMHIMHKSHAMLNLRIGGSP